MDNTIFKTPGPKPVEVEGVTVYVKPLTAGGLAKLLHGMDAAKNAGEPWTTDFGFVASSVQDAEASPSSRTPTPWANKPLPSSPNCCKPA
jgi:hypothetical protein